MSAWSDDPQLARLERDSLIVAGVMTLAAALAWPGRPARAFGVAGGLALVAVSYLGIRAGVSSLWNPTPPAPAPVSGAPERSGRPGSGFVKFFTRFAILAVGAYVMMARLEFDPMAMLAGVTAPAVAASVEFARTVRARHGGPHSRSS